ncbi:apolipoprotein N-acyltransferase [Nitratifractor sp.]
MLTAMAGSAFLYLAHWGHFAPWLETPLALLFLTLLLAGDRRIWIWSGFFLGLFWFGWIGMSFLHYGHPWAVPFVSLAVAGVYALLFGLAAWLAEGLGRLSSKRNAQSKIQNVQSGSVARQRKPQLFTFHTSLFTSIAKAFALWLMSLIHPFGFDWFKPELVLIHTPFGVDGVHFALLLAGLLSVIAAAKARARRRLFLMGLGLSSLLAAIHPQRVQILSDDPAGRIALAGTRVSVERKWQPDALRPQALRVLRLIDRAVDANRSAIYLPESVLPTFLNRDPVLLQAIQKRSRKIDIVLGALFLTPEGENRNSAYLFHDGRFTVADKVVLVPFGEANPLPGWAGRWINKIFFDGAPDYQAAKSPTDFLIDGKKFRAAVCFEGTSERLYADRPERMVLLSNNGWFVPSVEPTLQRLLLEYYTHKYGTEIWHAVNGSPSYIVRMSNEQ